MSLADILDPFVSPDSEDRDHKLYHFVRVSAGADLVRIHGDHGDDVAPVSWSPLVQCEV